MYTFYINFQPIAVFVEDESDIAAFENFTAADAQGGAPAPAAAEEAPKKETKPEETSAPAAESSKNESSATPSHSGRVLASPLARVSYNDFIYLLFCN